MRTPVSGRSASGSKHPIVLVISEIWGVHEYVRDSTRRFAKAGYYAVAPELFAREGGVAQIPNVQDVLRIVLAQKREQTLGDLKATVDWYLANRDWWGPLRDKVYAGERLGAGPTLK